jgi:tetratricopeptide (TPR) repeat protein
MSEHPAPDAASRDALVGRVVDEFVEALDRGERPAVEGFTARHPEVAGVLRDVLAALQCVRAAGPPSGEAGWAAEEAPVTGTLGDFRIVREVGRGGMGVVYEAEQISLGRRVALKVLPFAAALDAKQLQRFRNEAQAAAHLHHQNIVPVYAVGQERGAYFYAMQFIEGHTLAALVQEMRRLAGRERAGRGGSRDPISQAACGPAGDTARQPALALSTVRSMRDPARFRTAARLAVQAAEALEHAHGRGVVHRDVKPANLLVDGQGNLWVTDFGLAQVQGDARLTLTGDLVGTLRYMSPEQALAQPVAVDQRTDIYSLGATLYELLTLEPAFHGRDRQELLRQIAFEEPRRPRRVCQAVPAELETIVLMAMAKNPAERYATAQELADDLARFLKDEPILAKRPTLVQRARKWARRHRPAVWSAAAALLVTLAVLAGSVGWVVRDGAARQAKLDADLQAALDEGRQARREAKRPQAQAAARRAEALLQDGAAGTALAGQVRRLLGDLAQEEADDRLTARLEELRLLQAEVNGRESFDVERALPDYRQAFRDYGLRPGALAPEEAAARIRGRPAAVRAPLLAALDHWLILARYRRAPEADWLERVLAAADSDPWRRRVRAARRRGDRQALQRLAREADVAAQPPEALFVLGRGLEQRGEREAALALLRRAQEAFPGDFWINHNLGMALRHGRPPQYDEAIRFLTAAVAIRPRSAGARLNLGVTFQLHGRLDEAVAAFRKAIELKPDYAMAHNNLGTALVRKGRLDEAVAAFREAARLKPDLALAQHNLGLALADKGRFDEAIPPLRQAVALKPDFAEAHHSLGNVLFKKGRLAEAAAAWRRAVDLNPDCAEAHCCLGFALWKEGRPEEALAAFRRAATLKPDFAEAHYNLGNVHRAQGRLDEAALALRRAVALKPDWAMAHHDLGLALGKKGRPREAIAALRRAVALKPDCAQAHCDLGCVLCEDGRLDEAGAAFRRTLALEPDHAWAHYNLGNVHLGGGRLDKAVVAYRRALALQPDLAEAHCNLGLVLRERGDFAGALPALRRGHELGSRRPDWPYPSAGWLRECERLNDLAGRLPAVLKGEARPADPAEHNAYARLCYYQKLYAASARFRAEAFAADPSLADDFGAGHRHAGACAAALAAAGRGADAGRLGEAERARWRKQALAWLRADLAAAAGLLEGNKPEVRRLARRRLRDWQGDQDLAGLRDPAALAELRPEERQACRQLWVEVEALLARADAAR